MRTPLHAIAASAEMLLDGSLGPLTLQAQEAVVLMAKAARQLEERLDQFDEFLSRSNVPLPLTAIVPVADIIGGRLMIDEPGDRAQTTGQVLVEACPSELLRALEVLGVGHTGKLLVTCNDTTVILGPIRPVCDRASGEGAIAAALAGCLVERSGGRLLHRENGEVEVVLRRHSATCSEG